MRVTNCRVLWAGIVLLLLAGNLLGLSCWRHLAARSGQPDRLWWFEPSPLLAEYERLDATRANLEDRVRAADPTADPEAAGRARAAQIDLYPEVTRDQTARWTAAYRDEERLSTVTAIAGWCVGLAAGAAFCLYLYRLGSDRIRSESEALP